MARKFSELREKMDPERRARNDAWVAEEIKKLPLYELRKARELSQVRLAELLETTQSEVSKIERRTDMYVSTLRSYIRAMGGELEIVARFNDGAVRIAQFQDAEQEEKALVPA